MPCCLRWEAAGRPLLLVCPYSSQACTAPHAHALFADLWDAAVAAGKEGRAAVLEVVMDALASPPPPSTQARAGKQTACWLSATKLRTASVPGRGMLWAAG